MSRVPVFSMYVLFGKRKVAVLTRRGSFQFIRQGTTKNFKGSQKNATHFALDRKVRELRKNHWI